ncbi:MAG: nitrous oxide-stimulated promoter family protein [candidate division KSB1 bacterium]|nr:nitrous oxide-stimulated promoter family protein [candidate division KSB1 bacterium]
MPERRLQQEWKTVKTMIAMYCRAHHQATSEPCTACLDLLKYAQTRLEHCPFSGDKPVCSKCAVHCYSSKRREQIKRVMRYSGPRMMFTHPILAVRHVLRSINQKH